MAVKVLLVSDIEKRVSVLSGDIARERNTKEKARMVDEQAALKLVLRTSSQKTAEKVR